MRRSMAEIERGSWWHNRSSGYAYKVYMIRAGKVHLDNETGFPEGRFGLDEFREKFFNIDERIAQNKH